MEDKDARLLNNKYVGYMMTEIIISGICLIIWIINIALKFTSDGEWFLYAAIIFLALAVFWYSRIKRVKKLIKK